MATVTTQAHVEQVTIVMTSVEAIYLRNLLNYATDSITVDITTAENNLLLSLIKSLGRI